MTAKGITDIQARILRNLVAGRWHLHGAYGLSEHGGWGRSFQYLVRRGLATYDTNITDEGREALRQHEEKK